MKSLRQMLAGYLCLDVAWDSKWGTKVRHCQASFPLWRKEKIRISRHGWLSTGLNKEKKASRSGGFLWSVG